jgi:hypothetical protein
MSVRMLHYIYIERVLVEFGIEHVDDGLQLSLLLNTTP